MAWFRVYDDILDDPKVQRLAPALFKHLVNLWCIAKRCDGYLPGMEDMAFRLRAPEKQVADMTGKLVDAGLVDILEDGRMQPHNWNERQFVSDSVTSRVRKHREKHPKTVPRNDDETFHETHQSRTEAEQNRTEETPSGVSSAQPADEATDGRKARRKPLREIPADWRPSENGLERARSHGFGDAETERILQRFRDHWISKAERRADWDATWRTWIDNEVEFARKRTGPAAKPDLADQRERDRAGIVAALAPDIHARQHPAGGDSVLRLGPAGRTGASGS